MSNKKELKYEKVVSDADELIKENGGYCLCAILRNENSKCPCPDFRESEPGVVCGCGIYRKL